MDILTSFNVVLDEFEAAKNTRDRESTLDSFAAACAGTLGRIRVPVNLSESGEKDVWLNRDTLHISRPRYVDRALAWDHPKRAAAVFGAVARVVARDPRTPRADRVAPTLKQFLKMGLPNITDELGDNMAANLAALETGVAGSHQLREKLPGVGGALGASFLVGLDLENVPKYLSSTKHDEKWRGIWSALVAETVMPGAIAKREYPDEETREAIRTAARWINDLEPGFTYPQAQAAIDPLLSLLAFEEEEEEDDEGGGAGGDPPPPGDPLDGMDFSLDADEEEATVPSVGSLNDTGTRRVSVKNDRNLAVVTESDFAERFRSWLVDERLENVGGKFSGRPGNLKRIITDGRVMRRRQRVTDPPDAAVILMVDGSGSMLGMNYDHAVSMHDAAALAATKLGIEVWSCVYGAAGANSDLIIEVNRGVVSNPRQAPKNCPNTNNGEEGALSWALRALQSSGKRKGVVVWFADGQFTTISAPRLQAWSERNGLVNLHVDFANNHRSPFGGYHVLAGGRGRSEVAEGLAQEMARALGLVE